MYNLEIIDNKLFINNIKLIDVNYKNNKFICYGLYGIIEIYSSKYLIAITDVKKLEQIFYNDVFEIKSCRIIPLFNSKKLKILKEVEKFFKMPGMYFSKYSLYNNLQTKSKISSIQESDFMFNFIPYNNALDFNLKPYLVKCIQGYFKVAQIDKFRLCLISRRAWKRAGTRYFSRGLNTDGYPSNFVETEQIVFYKNKCFSFLQIRGSIPLIWSHFIDLKYAPSIIFKNENLFENSDIILKKKYTNILYLNLIKNEGYEGKLNDIFKKYIKNKQHINIDFHNSNVVENKYKREKFINLIDKYIKNYTIRTNCMDCLDRTNYVQYLIGENYLKKCLPKFFYFSEHLQIMFKKLWYENGNNLSFQYAGTPALKSDIILKGRITCLGQFNDLKNSIKRYFINRYSDGKKQSVYNILTCNKYFITETQKVSKFNFIVLDVLMKICVNFRLFFILIMYLIYLLMIFNLDVPEI